MKGRNSLTIAALYIQACGHGIRVVHNCVGSGRGELCLGNQRVLLIIAKVKNKTFCPINLKSTSTFLGEFSIFIKKTK